MENTKKTSLILFLYIIIAIAFGVILWYPRNNSVVIEDTSRYKNQIDSLQRELNSIIRSNDSIDQRIDTIKVNMIETKVKYEKDRNIILNNTPSADKKFFTDYINSNRERLYSDDNY